MAADARLSLSADQIDRFVHDGVLVVDNVLSPDEVSDARQRFHACLQQHGVDPNNLETTGSKLRELSSTGGAGGVLDLFYPQFKLEINEHPNLFAAISQLWAATYASGTHALFKQPFGPFDASKGYIWVDRVCYRVPDTLSQLHSQGNRPLQRCLAPHFDCCPTDMYGYLKEDGKRDEATASKVGSAAPESSPPKWRPIQCMLSLTDNLEADHGGFEAAVGFHKEFEQYYNRSSDAMAAPAHDAANVDSTADDPHWTPPPCVGSFARIRAKEDRSVMERCQHVPYKAGSAIFFDWRTPHSNSAQHIGLYPREVLYTNYLPYTEINKRYIAHQLRVFRAGLPPSDQWQKRNPAVMQALSRIAAIDLKTPHAFSRLGRLLMGIDSWDAADGSNALQSQSTECKAPLSAAMTLPSDGDHKTPPIERTIAVVHIQPYSAQYGDAVRSLFRKAYTAALGPTLVENKSIAKYLDSVLKGDLLTVESSFASSTSVAAVNHCSPDEIKHDATTSTASGSTHDAAFFLALDKTGSLVGMVGIRPQCKCRYKPRPSSEAGNGPSSVSVESAACQDAELLRLCVEPDAQRQGIATQLIKQVEAFARSRGYKRVVLCTLEALTAAVSTYRSLGYQDDRPPVALGAATRMLYLAKSMN